MLALIALTSFLTIVLAVIALAQRPDNPLVARLDALGADPNARTAETSHLRSQRQLTPAFTAAVQLISGLFPKRWYQRLEGTLTAAGNPIDAGRFLLLWVLLFAGAMALGWLGFSLRGAIVGAAIGGFGPPLWLRHAARTRRKAISRAVPDAIDLLVACVEAGLGIDAAFIRVGEATDGPLGVELRRTLAEISVGRPRQEALRELGERADVEELLVFLRPVVQAERTGVAIADALRVEAEGLRERRRQRAQEAAQKVPAKATLPMVFFFLPAIMLMGIAPIVYTAGRLLSGLIR
jgi:tight adherence protein C